jgi:integrase
LAGPVASVYVLSWHGGQPINPHTLNDWWRKARAAAGVPDARFHDIRAKAGTDTEAAGRDAQRFLGHTDPRTTRGYLRGLRVALVEPLKLKRG